MSLWRENHPGYKAAKNLAECCLCPTALWRTEFKSVELGHLVGEIAKQSVRVLHGFS
jgi:hypothetical protein